MTAASRVATAPPHMRDNFQVDLHAVDLHYVRERHSAAAVAAQQRSRSKSAPLPVLVLRFFSFFVDIAFVTLCHGLFSLVVHMHVDLIVVISRPHSQHT